MKSFDEIIDRTNTRSTKWSRYQEEFKGEKLYPLWLADMDFAVAEAIQEALIKRAEHPIYGYTDRTEEDYRIFAERFNRVYGYGTKTEDIILSTGVMYSMAAAIELFTQREDSVIVPSPAYPPFFDVVKNSGRRLITVPMKEEGGRYELDLEGMKESLDAKTKAVILCNPHNPTGRVFSKEELQELAEFCEENRLLIFSDEIHCDFVYEPSVFYPVMNINEYTMEHTVAMAAPTKSFNLAGLKVSAAVIKNKRMNDKFRSYAAHIGIASINLFALEALRAAYGEAGSWLSGLQGYLDGNRRFVFEFLSANLPQIHLKKPEGTYFYWMDLREGSIDITKIHEQLKRKGHVILNEGSTFGKAWLGFERLNMACPRKMLEEALFHTAEALRRELI